MSVNILPLGILAQFMKCDNNNNNVNIGNSGGGGGVTWDMAAERAFTGDAIGSSARFIMESTFFSTNLKTASFPAVTDIGSNAFANCLSLTTISFPAATSIGDSAFNDCIALMSASFPAATTIGSSAFAYCTKLTSLNLVGVSRVPTLGNSAFASTPIGGYAGQYGSVYVPASLYNSFLTATNWSSISSRIVSVA